MQALSTDALQVALEQLEGWIIQDAALEKNFLFADFRQAMAFLNAVAEVAEQMQHHPDIWNVYNNVRLRLHTHDAQAITQLDVQLAQAINNLSASFITP